jgi:hypothetical protein
MTDIIRIKNALPEISRLLFKQNFLTMGWSLCRDIVSSQLEHSKGIMKDDKTFPTFQFSHFIKNVNIRPEPVSLEYESVFKAVNIIANKCGYVLKEDKRLKFNLLMPHPKFNNTMYNIPHIDDTEYTNEIWNIIYYPEDYDGDTIIFNEKFDGKRPKELTIRERIKPQENSAIMFKGDIWHASSNPIKSPYRVVLNANITVEDNG